MRTKKVNLEELKNPFVEQFLEEYDEKDVYSLAEFIDDNWGEITGLTNRNKDQEGYFPEEIENILDELDIDYDDFGDAWGSVREGANDWEPRECVECGEDIEDYRDWEGENTCQACADKKDDEDFPEGE